MTALKSLIAASALLGGVALATGACGKVGALEAPGQRSPTTPSSSTVPPSATSDTPTITRRGADPLPAGLTESGAVRSSDGSTDPDENAPRTKRDIQDPNTRLAPLPVQPVDGAPNPFGSPVSTRPPG